MAPWTARAGQAPGRLEAEGLEYDPCQRVDTGSGSRTRRRYNVDARIEHRVPGGEET